MPTIDVNGTSLDYVERGQGASVVLVHGSASDRRTWQPIVTALSETYRTVAYSRRFHWPNRPIDETSDYPMDEHISDLGAVIEMLDLVPAHLVGHSYGAFVSLLLAIERPDLVRSVVLIEPPLLPLFASNPPRPLEILKLLVTRPRTATALIRFGAKGIAPATAAVKRGESARALDVFGKAVLGHKRFARLSPHRMEQVRQNFIDAEFVGAGFAPIRPEDVRGLDSPVLLVAGEESPAFFHRVIDRLVDLLPNARRVVISEASHLVHEDNEPAFLAEIRAFLQEASQPLEGSACRASR